MVIDYSLQAAYNQFGCPPTIGCFPTTNEQVWMIWDPNSKKQTVFKNVGLNHQVYGDT